MAQAVANQQEASCLMLQELPMLIGKERGSRVMDRCTDICTFIYIYNYILCIVLSSRRKGVRAATLARRIKSPALA